MMLPRRSFALAAAAACAPALRAEGGPSSVHDPARLIVSAPLTLPGLERARRVRVYLPPGYAQHPDRHYPVLYFHDGQNLFDTATAYKGEWGVDEALDRRAEQGLEAIAVGIDNGGALRMRELNPWPRGGEPGEGFAYLRFLVEVVKPWVDARWRTRPEAASTALIGASMGGLITQVAMHRHREVFGLGAVFSPAFWLAPQAFDLAMAEPLLRSQRLYYYAGGAESEDMVPLMRRMARITGEQVAAQRLSVDRQAGHNEAAWQLALPHALAFLFPAE